MGSFAVSLKNLGDREGLPATIHLRKGRLSIAAGDSDIGDWDLDEIHLEPTPTGYRMAAEGDQVLLEVGELDAFADELSKSGKRQVSLPSLPSLPGLPDADTILAPVDRTIEAAERKFGSLLPKWVFTRIMFGVVFGTLILMIVLPGWVSTFLLIAGVLVVLFGAIVYTDTMLASKWLPGRTTPAHVLIFGVLIVLLGVLLGVLAH